MPQITEINEISGCENNALNITISANIQEVRWYDRETDGKMVFEGLSCKTTTFWLQPYPEDCSVNTRVPLKVTIYPYPDILTPLLVIEQCDEDNSNDGITLFNLTGFESKLSRYFQNETFEYFQRICPKAQKSSIRRNFKTLLLNRKFM